MLIPGALKPYNLHGFMPELTFAVTLLEESLLKTEGIHKSRGLKERLSGVRFIGRRFACLQMAAALLRGVRRARRSEGRQIRQLCPALARAPCVGRGVRLQGPQGTWYLVMLGGKWCEWVLQPLETELFWMQMSGGAL